ncbi:MAG TPA: DUF1858 domain-containing protein [Bacilli bacterium]|nr:DUF1858 domain-containing protein [Bacilli bacterium]
MYKITTKQTIYELITTYPELIEVLKSIGFERITDPLMSQTVGKFMTLASGSKMKNIDLQIIKEALEKHGFHLEVV